MGGGIKGPSQNEEPFTSKVTNLKVDDFKQQFQKIGKGFSRKWTTLKTGVMNRKAVNLPVFEATVKVKTENESELNIKLGGRLSKNDSTATFKKNSKVAIDALKSTNNDVLSLEEVNFIAKFSSQETKDGAIQDLLKAKNGEQIVKKLIECKEEQFSDSLKQDLIANLWKAELQNSKVGTLFRTDSLATKSYVTYLNHTCGSFKTELKRMTQSLPTKFKNDKDVKTVLIEVKGKPDWGVHEDCKEEHLKFMHQLTNELVTTVKKHLPLQVKQLHEKLNKEVAAFKDNNPDLNFDPVSAQLALRFLSPVFATSGSELAKNFAAISLKIVNHSSDNIQGEFQHFKLSADDPNPNPKVVEMYDGIENQLKNAII